MGLGRYSAPVRVLGGISGALGLVWAVASACEAGVRKDALTPTARVTDLAIEPAAVTLNLGRLQQFLIRATWSDGTTEVPALTWTATGGNISSDGLYTAPDSTGSFEVTATAAAAGISETAAVTVTAAPPPPLPVLIAIDVTPDTALVPTNGTLKFTVVGRLDDGSTAPVAVTFRASCGSVTGSGSYTAPAAPGDCLVIGTQQGGAGLVDTSFVIVEGPPTPADPSCPNEPAGLTVLTNQPWDAVPPYFSSRDANGWGYWTGQGNLAITRDSTAPKSSPNVLRLRWPAGHGGGNNPFGLALNPPVSHKTIYYCFWLKVTSGFTNNGNTGTKWGFAQTPLVGTSQYSHYYINLFEGTTGQMGLNLESAGGTLNRNSFTNFKWSQHFNQWHRFEVLTIANTQGQTNGIIRFWVDGTLDYQLTNVKFFLDGVNPPGWNDFNIVGTYGGGTNPAPRDMFVYLDHYYISAK